MLPVRSAASSAAANRNCQPKCALAYGSDHGCFSEINTWAKASRHWIKIKPLRQLLDDPIKSEYEVQKGVDHSSSQTVMAVYAQSTFAPLIISTMEEWVDCIRNKLGKIFRQSFDFKYILKSSEIILVELAQ